MEKKIFVGLTALGLLALMVTSLLHLGNREPLNGSWTEYEKPELCVEAWMDGSYQTYPVGIVSRCISGSGALEARSIPGTDTAGVPAYLYLADCNDRMGVFPGGDSAGGRAVFTADGQCDTLELECRIYQSQSRF